MATKPVAWQEQSPVSSQDEWVNEFWAQGEVGATASHNSPLQEKKAPRAEPEDDMLDETLQGSQMLSRSETVDATISEDQESTGISLCTVGETQEMVTDLEQVAQLSEALKTQEVKCIKPCEDAFPPLPNCASSTQECFEKESLSSLEGEEWISDTEIISDPTEDHTSPDSQNSHECPHTPFLAEPVNKDVESSTEEMTGDNLITEENDTQLNASPDDFDNSELENNVPGAAAAGINPSAHHSLSDGNSSDDVYTVCSPPFADESEEEEEVSSNIMSCQQQWTTLDISDRPLQASYSANVSTEQDPTFPVVPSMKQQEELLSQDQRELAPKGVNQEAAQQVLGQSSLSTVAMELPNQGGAASQGSGCVVRERHSRAGVRTEGESEQTGGEGGQKESRLEKNKAVGQQHDRRPVQTQKLKQEKHSFVSSIHTRMESDSCDESDSGVSADFSPCSTLEGNTTIATGTPAPIPKETPIEREIRRAIEREHSLRRSRGLPNPPTSPEYVEIPLRKTVLCQSITDKSERCQGKDRQFAGKKMQHDIHAEAQREQDLVKLGKVPGFYDKGTVRQLKERKQLFEAFQKPNDSTLSLPVRSKTTSWSSASDISTLEDVSSQASTIGGSYVERIPTQSQAKGGSSTPSTPRGPGFSEGTACQVIILENNLSVPSHKLYHAKPETVVDSRGPNISSSRTEGHGGIKFSDQEKEEREEEEMVPKENPFFKLRSSTNGLKVEQDIREAQEREKELHKQRISLYGGTEKPGGVGGGGGGGGRPLSTEVKSNTLSPTSINGLAVPDLPCSSSRGGTRPPAARQSVGKMCVWPPAQAEDERINCPESPRTPRHKSPLVQRWESGQVNGHNIDED